MGLGGNLIWTSVFHKICQATGEPATACSMPLLSDLVAGNLYRRGATWKDDPVFRGNPEICHIRPQSYGPVARIVDKFFSTLVAPDRIRRWWERVIFTRMMQQWTAGKGPLLVHIDMRIHSYASGQDSRQTYWKTGGPAAHVMAAPFGFTIERPECRIFLDNSETATVNRLLDEVGIDGPFIVVEPDTNRDWFGDLRAWPMDRWQLLVDQIRREFPHIQIVQTGLGRSGLLDHVVDLTGKTSFRGAAALLARAGLFIGTEGGLMHLAAAADCPSVILWGGITLPEFAGYPHKHHILCQYVDCAPCGHAGWCDNGHICMQSISEGQVWAAVMERLPESCKVPGDASNGLD